MKHLLLLTALFALISGCGDNKSNNPVTPDPPTSQDHRLYGTWAGRAPYGQVGLTFYRDSVINIYYYSGRDFRYKYYGWRVSGDSIYLENRVYHENSNKYDLYYFRSRYRIDGEDTLVVLGDNDLVGSFCNIPLLRQP